MVSISDRRKCLLLDYVTMVTTQQNKNIFRLISAKDEFTAGSLKAAVCIRAFVKLLYTQTEKKISMTHTHTHNIYVCVCVFCLVAALYNCVYCTQARET